MINTYTLIYIASGKGKDIGINGAQYPTIVTLYWDGQAWIIREYAQKPSGLDTLVFDVRTDSARLVWYHWKRLTR